MTTWQNCQPEDYEGDYPMIQICDNQESYCAPMAGKSQSDMVEEFIEGYRFSDETEKCLDELRDGLRNDLAVKVFHRQLQMV